jgi:hypothetical protein
MLALIPTVHIKTNKQFHINVCLCASGFGFNWQITFKNKHLNCVIFTNSEHSTFKIHAPNTVTVQLLPFIKTQFTTDDQHIVHLNQYTHGHVSPLNFAHFQRSRGGATRFDTYIHSAGEVSLDVHLELNTLVLLSVSTDTDLQHCDQHAGWLQLVNCLHTHVSIDRNSLRCRIVGKWLLKFAQAFYITL